MTTAVDLGQVPDWDLQDRMLKALRVAGMTALGMAEYLDVTRGTVANWLHGKIRPSTQTLMLWALRTGVPYGWLVDGEEWVRRQGLEPRTRWLSVNCSARRGGVVNLADYRQARWSA